MKILMMAAENNEGLCKTTKESVPCSLIAIKAHNDKNYKSLAFIKKMRNVAQKVLTGCNGSLRVEVGKLFKLVWSELKCERGGSDKQMGQRSNFFNFIAEELNDEDVLDSDSFFEKNKTLCSFDQYHERNAVLFGARNGLSPVPALSQGLILT